MDLDGIADLITGFFDFTVELFYDLFDTFFYPLVDFFYELLFVDFKDMILSTGESIVSYFFQTFSDSPISFEFLFYYVGFIFIIFVIRQVVSILR